MGLEWFRDLTICILGLVATGVLIFVAVLLYSLYRRTRSILDSVEITSKTIQRIVTYVGDEVVKPVSQVVALVQGIRQGIGIVSKFFGKSEGGRND